MHFDIELRSEGGQATQNTYSVSECMIQFIESWPLNQFQIIQKMRACFSSYLHFGHIHTHRRYPC